MLVTTTQDSNSALAEAWDDLVTGRYQVDSTPMTAETCSLVLVPAGQRPGELSRNLSQRHLEILRRFLLGGAQKCLAIDFGLAPSSVATLLQQCFRFMGLRCAASRAPLVLVIAAHSRNAHAGYPTQRTYADSGLRKTVSVRRPDTGLAATLPPAEYAVIQLVLEGKSYKEMARERRTSINTVANQVTAAYRRLGVSGRPELLSWVARGGAEAEQRPRGEPIELRLLDGRHGGEPCRKQVIAARVRRGTEVAIRA